MRLPEYVCPHCAHSVTLLPGAGREGDRCSDCKGTVVVLADGQLAVPLPLGVSVDVRMNCVEVAFERWCFTLGVADRALRYRVEPDEIVWSRAPPFANVRLNEAWERL